MKKTINIPISLRPVDAIKVSNHISRSQSFSDFIYNFEHLRHCPPFGLLTLLSAIKRNIQRYPNSSHTPINIEEKTGASYAKRMGFFNAINDFYSNDILRYTDFHDNNRIIPIKKITKDDLYTTYSDDSSELGEMVESLSCNLAFMLTQEKISQAYKTFSYCIREIIRNVFEHSLSESAWICGEYWPSRNNAQIAIMDEGIGILRSLKGNINYSILKNDKEANNLALEAGVSCTLGKKQYTSQIWQNSGYGLYMAKSLCLEGGFFILASGENTIFMSKTHKKEYESAVNGTIISLSIQANKITELSSMLSSFRKIGEEQSKQKDKRIITASYMSTSFRSKYIE